MLRHASRSEGPAPIAEGGSEIPLLQPIRMFTIVVSTRIRPEPGVTDNMTRAAQYYHGEITKEQISRKRT